MTVTQTTPLHHTRGGRLLALLLAVLLSVTSLAGHATMDACNSDCATTQVEMLDNTDTECGTCAALAATPLVTSAHPDTLAGIAPPAVVEYFSPPPRQPPRS